MGGMVGVWFVVRMGSPWVWRWVYRGVARGLVGVWSGGYHFWSLVLLK